MKPICLLLSLLFAVSARSEKPFKALLLLHDGAQKEVLMYKLEPHEEQIKFRETTGSELRFINSFDVKAIVLETKKGPVQFHNISSPAGPHFYQLLVEGPVSLYGLTTVKDAASNITGYLVKRPHEKEGTRYNGLDFKKRMTAYFADDPTTVEFIQRHSHLNIDLFEVVHTYNKKSKS